jgi:hypothetical protein
MLSGFRNSGRQLRQARLEIRAGVRLIISYYNGTLLVFLERRDQSGE